MNITIFIILGALIAIIIAFIGFSSIKDRKARKKEKAEKIKEDKEIELSEVKVATALSVLIKANQKLLKDFVPSVGKIKMSDIKNAAKHTLSKLEKRIEFKYLSHDEDKGSELSIIITKMKSMNSNIWDSKLKQYSETIENKAKPDENSKDDVQAYKKMITEFINKEYKNVKN